MNLRGRVLPLAVAATLLGGVRPASSEILFKGRLTGEGFHAHVQTETSVRYTIDVYPIEAEPASPPLAVLQVGVSKPDGFWGCILDFPPASVLARGADGALSLNVDLSGLSPCENASELRGTLSVTARPDAHWRSRYVGTRQSWLGDVRILWNGIWEQTSATLHGTIMGADVARAYSDAAIHGGNNIWVTVERAVDPAEPNETANTAPAAPVAHLAGVGRYATTAKLAVARARALLDVHVSVPVAVIRPAVPLGHPGAPVAWVSDETRRIFVLSTSAAYRRAERGDGILLASALAHEQFHIEHGPEEGPAYEEQIRVLRRLGARIGDIEQIAKVKAIVVEQNACGEDSRPIVSGPSSGREPY